MVAAAPVFRWAARAAREVQVEDHVAVHEDERAGAEHALRPAHGPRPSRGSASPLGDT